MELLLVGLSGAGKTTVARLVAERTGAQLVDLDAEIERRAGRPIADIFATDGEATFRALEADVVADLADDPADDPTDAPDEDPTDVGSALRRVIAAGGGAVVDPVNRWRLYRGRRVAWLDAPVELLADRLAGAGEADRPLVASAAGTERSAALGLLLQARRRFYAAGERVPAEGGPAEVADRLLARLGPGGTAVDRLAGTRLLDAATPLGRIIIGAEMAAKALGEVLEARGARRVAIMSEPEAWRLHGERLADAVRVRGLGVEVILLPRGERAKTLRVLEATLRDLAARRLERQDPIVAVGGGALGDVAGFAAATYLRGVPLIQVPTTLLAQLDASIGGKTAVDLPEGKNLVGAFHQPAAVIIDVALLATLPSRQVRAALGEAVKMGILGDERLLQRLEASGPELARQPARAVASGALAEVVERAAWAKIEVVVADEREAPGAEGRIRLNLGHSFGHAIEAAAGYRRILHGEAVAYGLRGALAVGKAVGLTPSARAERIRALLDRLDLARRPPDVSPEQVMELLAADKKMAGGRLRWVLPTADGATVRDDVPPAAVEAGLAAALGGRGDGKAPR